MKSHGRVKFHWDDEILYVEAFGPFNEEGIQKAANTYLDIISNRKTPLFSVIEIWDSDSLASPEEAQRVGKLWNSLSENGCRFFALVASTNIQGWLGKGILPDIGKIFTKKEDAEQWIKEQKKT